MARIISALQIHRLLSRVVTGVDVGEAKLIGVCLARVRKTYTGKIPLRC